MDIENQEVLYYEDDDEYRVYCEICNKLCMERFYKKSFEIRNAHKYFQ